MTNWSGRNKGAKRVMLAFMAWWLRVTLNSTDGTLYQTNITLYSPGDHHINENAIIPC